MVHVTIVGAGVHGTRMVGKYKQFKTANLKAVVSRHTPTNPVWAEVPFCTSAKAWKKQFGTPTKHDVFDINVHQEILLTIVKEFVAIGAKNFILPKPIALTPHELDVLQALVKKHTLNVLVASQWHYSAFVPAIAAFLKKHKKNIAEVEIVFSRLFEGDRAHTYTIANAFLPHMLQMGADLSLVSATSVPLVEELTDTLVTLRYLEGTPVRLVSNLREPKRQETLKVFLKGKKSPALVANFAHEVGPDGQTIYPSITIDGKKEDIVEDVLEVVVAATLVHFTKPSKTSDVLTFAAYTPVATQVVRVAEYGHKTVAVVGGGIFGILSALEIANKGYPVVIFEKQDDVLRGASFVNQCRVHMGYHYPRDEHTARESRKAAGDFEKMFAPAIRTIHNYYMMAKKGSFTSPEAYVAFCKKLKLPHSPAWPKGVNIVKDKIGVSLRVPEKTFDAHTLRKLLLERVAAAPNVLLLTSTPVVGLAKNGEPFTLSYKHEGRVATAHFGAVVNAAYEHANSINAMVGAPLQNYLYEMIELLVVRTPWKNTGWFLGDGPFLGAIPFGFSKEHLMYDVDISVLERVEGPFPALTRPASYHNAPARLGKRLAAYYKKWEAFLPDIRTYKYVSSLYTTRMVLSKVEKTDARPTLLREVLPGMWQIFSGKITTSVPQAKELAHAIDTHLRKH